MNDETNASGQAGACDCLQCRLGRAYMDARPKQPTDEERPLMLGMLISTLAMEIANHPAPLDEMLMQAQMELIGMALRFKAAGQTGATKH